MERPVRVIYKAENALKPVVLASLQTQFKFLNISKKCISILKKNLHLENLTESKRKAKLELRKINIKIINFNKI